MYIRSYKSFISIENLLVAWEHFLRGKRSRKDVMLFQAELSANLSDLYYSLADQTYKHGPYSVFHISDPKPRTIHKAKVRDRIIHRLIYDNLFPYFDIGFVFDSYSCRKQKGTHRALDRFKLFAGKVSKNNSQTCYVLKCDIKKFFASVNHAVLLKILKRHIADEDVIDLIEKVISSFYSNRSGIGLPLGNLTSQILANVYLHEFDMFIKQGIRAKCYIRYTDDFVILSDNKEYLNSLLPTISEFLEKELKLMLHEHKVYIKTYASGLDFLGWVHFPHHRNIRTAAKRKIIRKLKGYPMPQTVTSYRGLLSHGDTHKLQKRVGLAD